MAGKVSGAGSPCTPARLPPSTARQRAEVINRSYITSLLTPLLPKHSVADPGALDPGALHSAAACGEDLDRPGVISACTQDRDGPAWPGQEPSGPGLLKCGGKKSNTYLKNNNHHHVSDPGASFPNIS